MERSDVASLLGVWLIVVGLVGLVVALFWLSALRSGVTPRLFTRTTRRIAQRSQRLLALWMIAANVMIASLGIAILVAPPVRGAVQALLGW